MFIGIRKAFMNLRMISNRMPPGLKSWIRWPLDLVIEIAERVTGARDELTPPYRLRRKFASTLSRRAYRQAGQDFLRFFTELCALKSDETILEVGSGCGRIAAALTGYLAGPGRYEGFEIVSAGVAWCHAAISSRFPAFHFQTADVPLPVNSLDISIAALVYSKYSSENNIKSGYTAKVGQKVTVV